MRKKLYFNFKIFAAEMRDGMNYLHSDDATRNVNIFFIIRVYHLTVEKIRKQKKKLRLEMLIMKKRLEPM